MKTTYQVSAFKHENSSSVDVIFINPASVFKGCLCGSVDNACEENDFCKDMFVRIYEGKSRFYYQTYYIEECLTGMPARRWYAYSSSKDCNPSVVAKEIIKYNCDLSLMNI